MNIGSLEAWPKRKSKLASLWASVNPEQPEKRKRCWEPAKVPVEAERPICLTAPACVSGQSYDLSWPEPWTEVGGTAGSGTGLCSSRGISEPQG